MLRLLSLVAALAFATSAHAQFAKAESALRSSVRTDKPVLVVVKAKISGKPEFKEKEVYQLMMSNKDTRGLAKDFTLAFVDVSKQRKEYDRTLLRKYGSTGLSVFVPGGTRFLHNVDIDAEGKKFNPKQITEGLLACRKAYNGWNKKRKDMFEKFGVKSTRDKLLRKNMEACEQLGGHYMEGRGSAEAIRLLGYAQALAKKAKNKKKFMRYSEMKADAARRGGDLVNASKYYDQVCRMFPGTKLAGKCKVRQIECLMESDQQKAAEQVVNQALKDPNYKDVQGDLNKMKEGIEQAKKGPK